MSPRNAKLPHGLLLGWNDPPTAGRKSGFPQPVWDDSREGHLVTVAPTGAGKGIGCIIPALLTWQGPAIVIDPKGENYAVTAARRQAMGQAVHVLDPFGITGCVERAALNPFDMLGPLESAGVDDMRVLAQACVQTKNFGKNQDPYWDSRATYLITEAIRYCAKNLEQPTLHDVQWVVDSYDVDCGHDRFNPVKVSCHYKTEIPFTPKGMSVDRTRSSIISTAVDQLSFIASAMAAHSLSRSTIALNTVTRGDPATIYLVLPPDKLITHGKLLRLWMTVLLNAIGKRGAAPRVPTLLLVDEAAQLGEMKELRSSLTLMRGYGMKVWTFWQDLSQLRKIYPDDWESLLNNSSFHQYFGASTPMAARSLQDYLGDTCPRPVTSLKSNQLALYRPGHKGSVARMPNYLADAMFEGLYDANPFHRREPGLPLDNEDFATGEQPGSGVLHFPAREGRDA